MSNPSVDLAHDIIVNVSAVDASGAFIAFSGIPNFVAAPSGLIDIQPASDGKSARLVTMSTGTAVLAAALTLDDGSVVSGTVEIDIVAVPVPNPKPVALVLTAGDIVAKVA